MTYFQTCWFCETNEAQRDSFFSIKLYKGNSTVKINIPRCDSCKTDHKQHKHEWGTIFSRAFSITILVIVIGIFIDIKKIFDFSTLLLYLVFYLIIGLFVGFVIGIISSIIQNPRSIYITNEPKNTTKSVISKYSAVSNLLKEGWKFSKRL